MSIQYRYVCDGLRLDGDLCTVREDDEMVECSVCKRKLLPGTRFTVGRAQSAKAVCGRCKPFNEQVPMFELEAPEINRSAPKQHLTMEDYQGEDGQWRHREQCRACNGKGKVKEQKKVGRKIVDVDVQCTGCTGHGYIWKLGKVSI